MASIKDVAKKAGVSSTTVSAVVNGLSCVKPMTRDKVLAAIQDLGYTPNLSARELVTRKKQNIGLISMVYEQQNSGNTLDSVTDLAYIDFLNGIAEAFETSDYGLLFENFCCQPGSAAMPKIVEQKRVDGVFVVGSLYPKEFIRLLKEQINTVVTVGSYSEYTDFVRNDYAGSIEMAVRYFIRKGHKKIAFASGDPTTYAYAHKLFGYRSGLEAAGLVYDEELVFESKFFASAGYEIAGRICELPREKMPTAILFASDILAAGACRYFYEHRLRVPDDYSLLGYENLIISSFLSPPLSTVEWHKALMAKEACRLMLQRLEKPSAEPVGIIMPCNILERNSVKDISGKA